MDFLELAKSRYSCKKFDSRQISKDQLDGILTVTMPKAEPKQKVTKAIEVS